MQETLTDQPYWDRIWDLHGAGEPTAPTVVPGELADFVDASFARQLSRGRRFLEVGAGGSPWPAHVARLYGAEAWGIDFSRPGLDLAARAIVPGTAPVHLVEGDFFDRELLPLHAFDVVYSAGFVEHFPSPQELMRRLAELLAEGGVVVTTVPNMAGINGLLQRLVDRDTFERHVVYTPELLDAAHRMANLVPVLPARYIGMIDLASVNYSRLLTKVPALPMRGLFYAMAKLRRAGRWYAEETGRDGGPYFAPCLGGVYRLRRSEDPQPFDA